MKLTRTGAILGYVGMCLVGLVVLLPLLWMIIMSVSSTRDLTTLPLHWIPRQLDFSRYHRLLTLAANSDGQTFLFALRNTVEVAIGTTVISFVLAVPASWLFSRREGKLDKLLMLVVATYMLPPLLFVVPLYHIFSSLSLLNSPFALMIADSTIVLPFTTWLLKGGIDAIPAELEQAAAIDGATLWRIWLAVTLPLARPIISTTILFSVLMVWDEFLYAMIFTSDSSAQTITVAIADLASGRVSDYGLLAAAGILAALPAVIIGACLQRALIAGLTTGGVKG
jgi:multiple sugar transport system permease protein